MAGKEPEAAGHPSLRDACPSARGCVRGGRSEHPWSCARPACGAVLFQLQCPVLLGTVFCPAVLLEQHQPTQSDPQSGSSGSGWPRVSLPVPIAGRLQHPREPLILRRKDPGALPPRCQTRSSPQLGFLVGTRAERGCSRLAFKPVPSAVALPGLAGLSARCRVRTRKLQVVPSVPPGPTAVPGPCLPSTGCEIPAKPAPWAWVKAVAPSSLIPYDVGTEN